MYRIKIKVECPNGFNSVTESDLIDVDFIGSRFDMMLKMYLSVGLIPAQSVDNIIETMASYLDSMTLKRKYKKCIDTVINNNRVEIYLYQA